MNLDQGGQQQAARRAGYTETVTVPANSIKKITAQGNVVRCISATVTCRMAIDNTTETTIFRQGIKRALEYGDQYSSLTLFNDTGGDATVELYIGFGDLADDLTQLNGSIDTVAISPDTGSNTALTVTIGTAPATTLIAALSSRDWVLVQNVGDFPLAIGFTNAVTGNTGIILEPKTTGNVGGMWEQKYRGAVYGCGIGGTTLVRIMQASHT